MAPEGTTDDAAEADAALLDALRAGVESAFATIVDRWSGSMIRVARGHVATDSAAEEVVQDTWLAVITGLDGFRGQSSLRTWVYRILVNKAKTRGARDHRVVPFASLESPTSGAAGRPAVDPTRFQGADERFPGGWREFPEEWPENALLAQEVGDVVREALRTLPVRQRVVVTLRDLHGHTAVEVSDLLDISTGNQRVLLHRGRSVVRAHLEQYFAGATVAIP